VQCRLICSSSTHPNPLPSTIILVYSLELSECATSVTINPGYTPNIELLATRLSSTATLTASRLLYSPYSRKSSPSFLSSSVPTYPDRNKCSLPFVSITLAPRSVLLAAQVVPHTRTAAPAVPVKVRVPVGEELLALDLRHGVERYLVESVIVLEFLGLLLTSHEPHVCIRIHQRHQENMNFRI
jgi:hypothetical protein